MISRGPDSQRIVITGVGLTAPNGNHLGEFREALLSGRSGVSKYEIRYVGETLAGICGFDELRYQKRKDLRRGTRAGSVGIYCSQEAVKDAGRFRIEDCPAQRFVLALRAPEEKWGDPVLVLEDFQVGDETLVLRAMDACRPSAFVEGRLVAADGGPLVEVEMWHEAVRSGESVTHVPEADGRFRIGPLRSGEYTLGAEALLDETAGLYQLRPLRLVVDHAQGAFDVPRAAVEMAQRIVLHVGQLLRPMLAMILVLLRLRWHAMNCRIVGNRLRRCRRLHLHLRLRSAAVSSGNSLFVPHRRVSYVPHETGGRLSSRS